MRRIAILGSGGAGKSTLASELGKRLGIQVIHLDAFYWKPGWVPMPDDEWKLLVEEFASGEEWIIDGNYGRTMDIRLSRADTVIFLDYSNLLCLCRALKRRVQYRGKTRPDMGPGCVEAIDLEFLTWIWNFPRKSRPKVIGKIEGYARNAKVIRLRSPKEAQRFLKGIETAALGAP